MKPTPATIHLTIALAAILLSHSHRAPFTGIPRSAFVVPTRHDRPRKIGSGDRDVIRFVATAPAPAPSDIDVPSESVTSRYHPHETKVADATTETHIVTSPTDGKSLNQAAAFMVDAYWLSSPASLIADDEMLSLLPSDGAKMTVTLDEARKKLSCTQLDDFAERYDGKRRSRLLHSRLLTAIGSTADCSTESDILGLIGMEVRLCDKKSNVIHSTQRSEEILDNFVNGEKDEIMEGLPHCAPKLVNELLPPEFNAVCVLSNLAVSSKARRQGLATKLCREVERLAKSYCGCDEVYLEVEENNIAARRLYEEKLGYKLHCKGDAPARRVDLTTGSFVNVTVPTLVLVKDVTSKLVADR
mmetsp:Transcript_35037/g.76816  ORF Transcript_35037/g.76816 Transcript_35037/m.76816 type:complete len:358 (-) Transcript_35037:60-1133(-)